ncbi:glutamate mutase L [Deltaproteobacteria bacterium OttesenSCG-928-K17]|nr:glutamate mutase L [Deltaproteobacteria bacterium OttesenSCG-928-K17]
MNLLLTADIGSTFTKVTAIDVRASAIIGTARSFTTIETNVMDGFNAALKELKKLCGAEKFSAMAASSSAAGGLKMVAVGLVPDLTVQAAKLAAANAGAKIQKAYAFELNQSEIDEITALGPDMILLSGGADGGNKSVIIHNAKALAASPLRCPIVAAGNKSAEDGLKTALQDYPGEVMFRPNVMPEVGETNPLPAQSAIRDLFIKNIVSAKGLSELAALMSAEIVPTPVAVFEAAHLLSRGTKKTPGLGELLVFDVGGATTDVYSMAEGLPGRANVTLRGLKQPFAKRTVEGDLGLRYSLSSLAEAVDIEDEAARLGFPPAQLTDWIALCAGDPALVPKPGEAAKKIDDALAAAAVRLSIARHCGRLETFFSPLGQSFVQTGKDLGGVPVVIGTGGPIINAGQPAKVLAEAVYRTEDGGLLKPAAPKIMIDADYILAAMGLLSRLEPEAALALMLEKIVQA